MKPVDILVLTVIAGILIAVAVFLIRCKKKGVKCIGCPDGHACSGNCKGCSCHKE